MHTYFQHARRHHPHHGSDPVIGAGIENHWFQASQSTSAATDAGAPGSPTPIAVGFSSFDKTSDLDGDVYFVTAGSPDKITVSQPGGYLATVIGTTTQGLAGYLSVAAVLVGDAWLGVSDFPGYKPLSFPGGVGDGVAVYRQPFAVLDTAVVGTATEVGVYSSVWQNSGSTRTINVTLYVERLT